MPTIPEFLVQKEKKRREKFTCYGVFLTLDPDASKFFTGDTAWPRAQQLMKGRPHSMKGFTNQIDANRWMAEQKAMNEAGTLHHKSPKAAAKASYPEKVSRARNSGMIVYNTDCSFDPGVSCALGVWSSSHFIQIHVPLDPAKVNHQRGELLAILEAFKHYEKNLLADPEVKGMLIFSDSEFSERTLNSYSKNYKKHRGTNVLFTRRNTPATMGTSAPAGGSGA